MRKQTPYWYLTLPLLLMVAFFLVPLGWAVWISVLDYSRDLDAPRFVALANYQALMNSPVFWHSAQNTVLFLLGVVPAMVVLPIFLALLVNGKIRGIALFRSLIYLPVVISMVVVGITWRWLYADDGLINYLCASLGLPKVAWLTSPDIALWAVMLVVIWKGAAYYMMMYLAHLQSLSQELYEAAAIDGAGFWGKLRHITLPHLRPTMVMVALISTIASLKLFTEIYVMTRGGPVGATQTMVYFIYRRAFENLDLGVASAGGLVLMIALVAVSLLELRFSAPQQEAAS